MAKVDPEYMTALPELFRVPILEGEAVFECDTEMILKGIAAPPHITGAVRVCRSPSADQVWITDAHSLSLFGALELCLRRGDRLSFDFQIDPLTDHMEDDDGKILWGYLGIVALALR